VFTGKVSAPVQNWKNRNFQSPDFSFLNMPGTFQVEMGS
jgi:hypothetical protein